MGVRWGKRFVFYWDENFVLHESCLADPCVAVDDSGCLVLLPGLLETSGRTSEAFRRARLKGRVRLPPCIVIEMTENCSFPITDLAQG